MFSTVTFKNALSELVNLPIYTKRDSIELINSPYHRPLPDDMLSFNYDSMLSKDNVLSPSGYRASLLLRSIYETDLFFLPYNSNVRFKELESFYSYNHKLLCEIVRSGLEKHTYGFLETLINVSGDWKEKDILEYFTEEQKDFDAGEYPNPTVKVIETSSNPQRAAKNFLIRLSPDTMAEGSALMRRLLGSFGIAQSELFKIAIDEYGYGVNNHKHSVLFLEMLESCNLNTDLHRYWNYYTPATLLAHNYFHYLSKNTNLFFRYLGKLFLAEASFSNASKQYARMLKNIFGNTINVKYFEEHSTIDIYHGRMVLKNIITEVIRNFGSYAIREILIGYESFKKLLHISNDAFCQQIAWLDACDHLIGTGETNIDNHSLQSYSVKSDINETDTEIYIEKGSVFLSPGYSSIIPLKPNNKVTIPKYHFYTLIISEQGIVKINK